MLKVGSKRSTLFMTALLLALVVAVMGVLPAFAVEPSSQLTAGQIYDQTSQSVVAIGVVVKSPNTTSTFNVIPQQPEVPSPNLPEQPNGNYGYGAGSGFVIDTQGHIVTNAHVVEDAVRIEVNFFDGTKARAEVVGIDSDSDIAVIQVDVDAAKLVPITWGDSDALDEGDAVVAIGSPYNQRWTITEGIVSALKRSIPGLTQFSIGGVIQTDAAINPGNSGGPLLNMRGEVVGVNSQIRTTTGGSTGVGFAYPANLVKRIAQDLIANGFVSYSYLGIQGGDVDLALIETLGLANDFRGVVVSEVVQGAPAARGGLKSAGDIQDVDGIYQVPHQVDIITAINGTQLHSMSDLIGYLATNTKPGDTVKLDVLRNGTEQLQLDVTLTPRPSAPQQ